MSGQGGAAAKDPEWGMVGDRLRKAREYLNFSQQFVADRTGIPRTAISDIERGERKVDVLELKKLARLYRHPITYFLDESADAEAGGHAINLLTRKVQPLSNQDFEKVMSFVEFLHFAHRAEQEDGVEEPDKPSEGAG